MSEPLVVVRELHKSFLHMGRELEVLKGIDLETVSYTHLTLPTIYSV